MRRLSAALALNKERLAAASATLNVEDAVVAPAHVFAATANSLGALREPARENRYAAAVMKKAIEHTSAPTAVAAATRATTATHVTTGHPIARIVRKVCEFALFYDCN